MDNDLRGFFGRLFAFVLVVVVVGGLFFGLVVGYSKTQGGEVAVVRNGGPFDNNKIRQVLPQGSSRTRTGLFSQVHRYPISDRQYTITSSGNGDRSGVDSVSVPSSNGVQVGIEGTIRFTLNASPDQLKQFDDKFGTRTFSFHNGDNVSQLHPYDGNDGWSAFLDQVVRPIIDNALREQIGNFKCSELVSSCALVENSNGNQAVSNSNGSVNNSTLIQVQNAINTRLESDIVSQLGGPYLTNIRFTLAKVDLPGPVQDQINGAQAQFAAVASSNARKQQAQVDADANAIRQRGYQDCPACAQIDTLKAIPPTVTTYAPGAGFAVTGK